jgi:hypothetical protein
MQKTDDIILVSAHHQIPTTPLKSNSPLLAAKSD